MKSVRFGVGLCLVCSTSVVVLGLIGVSVVLVGLIGVSAVPVIVRSVRGNHNVILEVSNTSNDFGRVLSFFLIFVCL